MFRKYKNPNNQLNFYEIIVDYSDYFIIYIFITDFWLSNFLKVVDRMNVTKLFIFDMDGLMFDTGRLAYQAYLLSAKENDFEVNPYVYYQLTGSREDLIREKMKQLYGTNVPVDIWRERINYYKKILLDKEKRVYKKYGLEEIINFAKGRGIKLVIASSSPRKLVDYYLKIEKLENTFDTIISGEDVEWAKPNPEIFLKACEAAKINPMETLVFEDSSMGIEAAKNANIRVCLIPDDIHDLGEWHGKNKLKKDLLFPTNYSEADFQFPNLLEARNYFERNMLHI